MRIYIDQDGYLGPSTFLFLLLFSLSSVAVSETEGASGDIGGPDLLTRQDLGPWHIADRRAPIDGEILHRVVLDEAFHHAIPLGERTRWVAVDRDRSVYEIPPASLERARPWIREHLGGVTVFRYEPLSAPGPMPSGLTEPHSSPVDEWRTMATTELPELRVAEGDFRLFTGILGQTVPDLGSFTQVLQVQGDNVAPEDAVTARVEYRVRVRNDPAPGDLRCSDYEIYLSSASHGAVDHLLVYDNLGGLTDGGEDDDNADDASIYLNYRPTEAFNGEDPNQAWSMTVRDTVGGHTGEVEFVDLRVYWQQATPELAATDVYFRTQPSGGGTRVTEPIAGQMLYAHFDFELSGPDFEGRAWKLEVDGRELCHFDGTLGEGSRTPSCPMPWDVTSGMHVLTARVDPFDLIDELNENDNEARFEFTVAPQPDIRIEPTTITLERQMPTPIYVEIDYLDDGAGHDHKPSIQVQNEIRQVFQEAGFAIYLKVDTPIPHSEDPIDTLVCTSTPCPSLSDSPHVQTLVSRYFGHRDDSRFFYSIWGHHFAVGGVTTASSGRADLPGRVHLVTLGNLTNTNYLVGTFVHEFGHNLGQRHGGADHTLCKPNYVSVMNYVYQFGIGAGILGCYLGPTMVTNSCDPAVQVPCSNPPAMFTWPADFSYSYGFLETLSSGSLDETRGLGLGFCIDWNKNNCIDPQPLSGFNLQNVLDFCPGFSSCAGAPASVPTSISDFDNWSQIRTNFARKVHLQKPETSEVCISVDEYRPIEQSLRALRENDPRMRSKIDGASSRPRRPATKDAAGSVTIYNDGDAPLEISSISMANQPVWIDWVPANTVTIQPGSSVVLQLFADLWQAPNGRTDRVLRFTSNDPDEPTVDIAVQVDGLGTCSFTSSTSAGGTATGDIEAACGTFARAKAFPASGYEFVAWVAGNTVVSTLPDYPFMLTSNRHLFARFQPLGAIFADGFESGTTDAWIAR